MRRRPSLVLPGDEKNKAGEKAFSGKQLSPRCSLSDVDLKKVAQDLSVNFAFKSREPPQIKLVGENPPEILKFCSFFSEIDIRIAAVKEAEIIDLFLAVKFAPFEFFIRESVAVTALFLQDREVLFFDSDFLSNLSKKCLFRCFIFINASLRKLPCSFFSAAFTDQDTRILLDKDGGDVGTVDWHAQANVLLPRSVATIKVSMAKVPSRRYVFRWLLGIVACWTLGVQAVRFFDVEGQVHRKQEVFIEAFKGRDWKDLAGMVSLRYSDRWELDAKEMVKVLKWLRSHFLFLDIEISESAELVLDETGEQAFAVLRHGMRIEGRGSPVAQEAMARTSALVEPFVFRWKKEGVWPGSWRLLSIDQGELRVSPEEIEMVLNTKEFY